MNVCLGDSGARGSEYLRGFQDLKDCELLQECSSKSRRALGT
jgi:hypothetical protein